MPSQPLSEMLKTPLDVLGIRLNEQPKYDVVKSDGKFEVRKYEPVLLAQLTVQGPYEEANDEAFKRLATYIYGGNKNEEDLKMTAPVLHQEAADQDNGVRKLEMSAPVFREQGASSWVTSFVMSSKFDIHSVPKPQDKDIKLVSLPVRYVAVFEYSGTQKEEKMREAEATLEAWLKENNLKSISSVRWAQYDPPFAIPFVKKNEAQVDIERV